MKGLYYTWLQSQMSKRKFTEPVVVRSLQYSRTAAAQHAFEFGIRSSSNREPRGHEPSIPHRWTEILTYQLAITQQQATNI